MSPASVPRAVPFHEARHFQPEGCLHYDPISVRSALHRWAIPTHRHEVLHPFQLQARRPLASTEMPVARIAGEPGFDDAYFSRLVARKVGLAPAAYRRAAAMGLAGEAAAGRH